MSAQPGIGTINRIRTRAELHREMAEYEHQGADLERWADLIDPCGARSAVRPAEAAVRQPRQGAKPLSAILKGTSIRWRGPLRSLRTTPRDASGLVCSDDAPEERQPAKVAHEAAHRALSQAEEWLRVIERQ
jgi:hypothetical protein